MSQWQPEPTSVTYRASGPSWWLVGTLFAVLEVPLLGAVLDPEGPRSITTLAVGVLLIVLVALAPLGVRALARRRSVTFEGWTVRYRGPLEPTREFLVTDVTWVRRRATRPGPHYDVRLAARPSTRKKAWVVYGRAGNAIQTQWLQRLAWVPNLDVDAATAADLADCRAAFRRAGYLPPN